MKVAVIGGGIVGLSTANWLKKYGQDVILYDREDPGSQASFGNAGTYANYANVPTNSSSFLYLFPYLAANMNSPLFFKKNYFLKSIPWLLKYLFNSNSYKSKKVSDQLTLLLSSMNDGYSELFKEADVEEFLGRESTLYLWSTRFFYNSAKTDFETRSRTGSKIEILNHDDISDLEPNIKNFFYKGAIFHGSYYSKNPKKISEKLLQLFISKGGIFLKEDVVNISTRKDIKVEVETAGSKNHFDKIIICAGAWSNELSSMVGDHFPLESERGYHLMYKKEERKISRPVSWQERGTYFTPMNEGLRVGGVVEFGGKTKELNPKVINFLQRTAKSIFPDLKNHYSEWVGFRPSTPDSIPVIGQSPKNPYIYYCFGHQHVGWTLGGISGKLIAQEVSANKTDIDLKSFSPERF